VKKFNRSELLRATAAIAIVSLITLSLSQLRGGGSGAPDFSCAASQSNRIEERIAIEVSAGESGSEIGKELFEKGVVKSSQAFFGVAVGDPRSARIAAGVHMIDPQICASQALEQLLDASRIVGLVSVKEGMWISEITPQLVAAEFSLDAIKAAIASVKLPAGFNKLEGLFFPAQYSFARGTSAADALASAIKRAERAMQESGFFLEGNQFTPQESLIIASLIQAEGKVQDFAQISRVIRNRLQIGMPLQFDSTVHYIQKKRGNIFLSTKSTTIDSAYNTYRRYGLPPGPINNPGESAMRAAMKPAAGNWLYFITVAPSDTRFTNDFAEFNRWKVEYRKNLRDGVFG
jgi:UPF0755 protein